MDELRALVQRRGCIDVAVVLFDDYETWLELVRAMDMDVSVNIIC